MTSATPLSADKPTLTRAEYLKAELLEFAVRGPLKAEYDRQQNLLLELSADVDEHEVESMRDWFLYDWFDENGEGVIEHFLEARKDLSADDEDILYGWTDSLNSIFEIREVGKNSLSLTELDQGTVVDVLTSMPLAETPFEAGQFLAARLLPLDDDFIFSGLQFLLPDRESAMEALEVHRALEALDSPESIENAQREQCSAVRELFGCDELSVSSIDLNSTLQKFQRYVFAERRDPESGLTAAERFRQEFGRDLRLPDMPPIPEGLADAGLVTILCDEFDGMVLLPDFNRFRTVFESAAPDRDVPGWQDLVWRYIKDPDIPIVAFERIAEQHPKRVEAVIRKLTGKKRFSQEHLYALLIHYKEPAEEFDELEDDERLWDLFDGNLTASSEGRSTAAPPRTKTKPRADKTAATKKSGKLPAKPLRSRKVAVAKSAAAAKPGRSAKSAPAAKPRRSAKSASAAKPAAKRGAGGAKAAKRAVRSASAAATRANSSRRASAASTKTSTGARRAKGKKSATKK